MSGVYGATVLASLYPHVFYGQNQLVFIDKGEKEGVHPGNRLLVTRREDAWGKSLAAPNAATRSALKLVQGVPAMDLGAKLHALAQAKAVTTALT